MTNSSPLGSRLRQSGIYRAFRHRDYAVFSTGSWVSAAGMWIQRVGIGVLTWDLTHSPAWLGGIALAQALPSMVLVPFAGAVADRVDRVRILRTAQICSALVGGVLAWMVISGAITIYWLAGLVIVLGVSNTMGLPALMTIAPTLVPREDLSAALATNSVLFHSTSFIGPAIGGVLIAQAGIGSAFVVNAASYLVMWALLFTVTPLRQEHEAGGGGLMSDVLEGIHYTAAHRGIGPVLLLTVFIAFLGRPVVELLPGFVDVVFGRGSVEEGVATLLSASGLGGFLGSLWLANRGRIEGMTTIFLVSSLLIAAAIVAFALAPFYAAAVVMMAVIGASGTACQSGAQILVQNAVDGSMRARVVSLYTLNYRAAPALGALLMGGLSALLGLQTPVVLGACLCAVAALWLMRRRHELRDMLEAGDGDSPPGPAAEAKPSAAQ